MLAIGKKIVCVVLGAVIRACLKKNEAYLRQRMTHYVVSNIKLFDGVK